MSKKLSAQYEAAKEYTLDDVIVLDGKVAHIGPFYEEKKDKSGNSTSKRKTFSVEFLRSFCAKNKLKSSSQNRDDLLNCINDAYAKHQESRSEFLAIDIEQEDDKNEDTCNVANRVTPSSAAGTDILAPMLADMSLDEEFKSPPHPDLKQSQQLQDPELKLNALKMDKIQVNIDYKINSMIIELTNQINNLHDRIVHLCQEWKGDEIFREQLEKEAFTMMTFFWKKRELLVKREQEKRNNV